MQRNFGVSVNLVNRYIFLCCYFCLLLFHLFLVVHCVIDSQPASPTSRHCSIFHLSYISCFFSLLAGPQNITMVTMCEQHANSMCISIDIAGWFFPLCHLPRSFSKFSEMRWKPTSPYIVSNQTKKKRVNEYRK